MRFGLQLLEPPDDFVEELQAILNRRSTFRVPMPHGRDATIRLCGTDESGPEVEGRFVDLSPTGLALGLPQEDTGPWTRSAAVELSFELSSPAQAFRVLGTVRHSCLTGQRLRVGIEFDSGRTPRWPEVERALRDYVMERQRELLERGLPI